MLLKNKTDAKIKWYPEKQIGKIKIVYREEEGCYEVHEGRQLIGVGDSEKEAYEIIDDYKRTA